MNKYIHWIQSATLAIFLTAQLPAFANCGSASCSINTQWDHGLQQQSGMTLDLRYEYINQNQLRTGSSDTSTGAGEALENRTLNRNVIGTLGYTFNQNWGVTISAPFVNRDHTHTLNDTLAQESWNYAKFGDIRITGNYQPTAAPFQNINYGFKFGAKLPTGSTDFANPDNKKAERTLQPGTGSTDTLLGAYLLNTSGSWFVQALWQHAVSSYDGFTPGDQITLDLGTNIKLSDKWNALLQLNTLHKDRDTGNNAEQDLSGGVSVFLSPGISYAIGNNSQIYGYIQKPVYQYVNGVQLTTDITTSIGLRHHF